MAVNEKLLKQINNLLNIANNSNTYKHEAENAMLKAQKLMAEHGIENFEMSNLDRPKEVLEAEITEVARLSWWEKTLGNIISKNFRCEYYLLTFSKKGVTIVFMGLKEDIEIAKSVFNFARMAIARQVKDYMRNYNKHHITLGNTSGIKNDYLMGFLKGLDAKFQAQINKEGWGLVLAKDPVVTEAYSKLKLRKGNSSSIQRSGNGEAYNSGYRAGNSFNSPRGMIQ